MMVIMVMGGDHDENTNDDDDGASRALKCRMPESMERLAPTASELEMIQRLQHAACQNL